MLMTELKSFEGKARISAQENFPYSINAKATLTYLSFSFGIPSNKNVFDFVRVFP
jgi:hypothetical protein